MLGAKKGSPTFSSPPPPPSPSAHPAPRVLGLDPGSLRTGWGVVESLAGGRLRLVAGGTIKSPGRQSMAERLLAIHEQLHQVIARHQPGEMAVEGVFAALNARTAIVLGQARGAAILAGAVAGLAVYEYPPASVKKALVGTGQADKHQVRAMVEALLRQSLPPPAEFSLDASDALAIAVCHLHSRGLRGKGLK
ncbi:MAG: crossover junction endodeoxyribonuclease RuvC [Desulfarculus sp.]|nr:crossover junction endodeoxyribonuclease RuvC [Desulfarculus sp.]